MYKNQRILLLRRQYYAMRKTSNLYISIDVYGAIGIRNIAENLRGGTKIVPFAVRFCHSIKLCVDATEFGTSKHCLICLVHKAFIQAAKQRLYLKRK